MLQVANCVIAFLYIFGFSFQGGTGVDSSLLVGLYLFACLLINKKYANNFFRVVKTIYFKNLLIVYAFINVYSVIVVLINRSSDISYLKTFFHMFILICIGMLLYTYYESQNNENKIVNYIIVSFVVQSIIEWMAFLIPSFKRIINLTKDASTIVMGQSYSGVRANALAGSDFFGLSSAFAIVFLIFWSSKNTIFKNNRTIKFIIYIVLLSGTFFSGRTGYIGLCVAILYGILYKLNNKRKQAGLRTKELLLGVIGIIGITFAVPFFVTQYSENDNIQNLFNFTFQSFINKRTSGSFDITSLQSLRNMYIKINPITFIMGDGQYIDSTGKYYMGTDVGYLRVILFMGIIGLMLLFLMQLLILKPRNGKEPLLKKILLLLLLILNLKGEVLVWGQIVIAVVILYSLQDLYNNNLDYGENYE